MGMSIFSHLYWGGSFSVIFLCCVTPDLGMSQGLHQLTADNGIDVLWQLRTKSALWESFWRKGNCLEWGNIQNHKLCHLHMEGQKAFLQQPLPDVLDHQGKKALLGFFTQPIRCLVCFCVLQISAISPPINPAQNTTWIDVLNLTQAERAEEKTLQLQLLPSAWGSCPPEPSHTPAEEIFKWVRKDAQKKNGYNKKGKSR